MLLLLRRSQLRLSFTFFVEVRGEAALSHRTSCIRKLGFVASCSVGFAGVSADGVRKLLSVPPDLAVVLLQDDPSTCLQGGCGRTVGASVLSLLSLG